MQAVRSKLQKKLKAKDSVERCGVILSTGKIIECKNIAEEPENSFEIGPEDMIREGVVATWHTHPRTSANLSVDDYAGFLNWPNLTHYIVSREAVRAYTVLHGMVVNS